jgi:general secretion pathway protein K
VSLLFTTYIAAARYRAIEAFAISQQARAEAFANAGVNLAIIELLSSASKQDAPATRFKWTGIPVLCSMDVRSVVAIAVTNENGKVDIDTAPPDLLEAVIRGTTSDDKHARTVTRSILKVREALRGTGNGSNGDDVSKLQRLKAFKSVMELGSIPGITQEEFSDLSFLVTVHSRSPGVNPRLATQALLDVLTRGTAQSRLPSKEASSSFFVAEAPGKVFKIATEAVIASGVRFARDAIVELAQGPPLTYSIREWREGSLRAAPRPGADKSLRPC